MELRHLRYFIAVAEELHFTRAAARLHIGQPPLSQQIQALEQEVGATLFERSRRWVRLTEAGKRFLEDARHILALAEEAANTARRAERGEIGELRIGFTPSTLLMPMFPAVINTYRKQFPQVALTLKEMVTMHQVEAISQQTLDIGFIRPPAAGIPPGITLNTLRHDPLTLVAPANHRLARKPTITVRDLKDEAFVLFVQDSGTGTYPEILRLCRKAGFEPKISMEASDPSVIISLVAAGFGISILPESYKCIRIKGARYRPIADPSAVMQLILASRHGKVPPPVAAFSKIALALASAP
ncbi:LysR family transcriptional regulator [Paucimonas lemoignei]|uniref:LysR family transcriptional regulator n=1 Tax=Paucimonas lemoignei TaxID=29443 RepID=A0A4R3HX20_PAULE|nr:LysR substrate-binding domain-containing protein [Paucimonas lemoignei]TCS37857.1 LysR family transcriptional regulator [Paucimonas lemoignei]